MNEKIVYEAQDGTIFLTEEACKEYEEKLNLESERILKAAREIQEVCLYTSCCDCPFTDSDGDCRLKENFPSQWDL